MKFPKDFVYLAISIIAFGIVFMINKDNEASNLKESEKIVKFEEKLSTAKPGSVIEFEGDFERFETLEIVQRSYGGEKVTFLGHIEGSPNSREFIFYSHNLSKIKNITEPGDSLYKKKVSNALLHYLYKGYTEIDMDTVLVK